MTLIKKTNAIKAKKTLENNRQMVQEKMNMIFELSENELCQNGPK